MTTWQSQHLVLCEGYDDRSFLKGVFEHLGRKSMRARGAHDAWGETLEKGLFGFAREGSPLIRLQSVEGLPNLERAAKDFLGSVATKPLASLTLVRDDDGDARDREVLDVSKWLDDLFPGAVVRSTEGQSSFDVAVDGTPPVRVYGIAWRAPDDARHGIPNQQTLERVVCAALAEVDGARAECVEQWLRSSPAATDLGPKSYSGSYIAKWHAEDRLDAFYGRLMTDERARERDVLKKLLADVWYVFERLAA